MSKGGTLTTVEPMTNIELGHILGLSHAQVSRYRSGTRLPRIETMFEIEEKLGWGVGDQLKARRTGKYPAAFEAAVTRYSARRGSVEPERERLAPAPHGATQDPYQDPA